MYKKAWCSCKVVVLLNINLLTFCLSRCKSVVPVAWGGAARKTYYDTKKTAFVVFAILDCSQVCPKWKEERRNSSPPLALASPFACGSLGNSRDSPKWRTCSQASLVSAHALFTGICTCFLARIEPLIRLILVNGFLSDSVGINSCVHNILKTITLHQDSPRLKIIVVKKINLSALRSSQYFAIILPRWTPTSPVLSEPVT